MRRGRILTPNDIKIPEFFKFELDIHDYVRKIYIIANLHFNPFCGGFSPDRRNITICDFSLVSWLYGILFLRHMPRSNRERIFTVLAHTTRFHLRTVLLG